MTIYYVYAYIRNKDSKIARAGTPYYIGKGTGNRAYAKKHVVPLPAEKSNIVFLESGLTEIGALALERRLIRWYGRTFEGGILRNTAEGGTGGRQPDHILKKISETLKGRFTGEKNPRYGKSPFEHFTPARMESHKKMLSDMITGEKNPMYGKPRTEEFKKLMRGMNCKAIYCPQTETAYPSVSEAARQLGIKQGDISNMLSGRQLTVKGYSFTFYVDQ